MEEVYKVTEYQLIAFDLVVEPSTGEFVNGILESKEFIINENGVIQEQLIKKRGRPKVIKPTLNDLLELFSLLIKEG